MALGAAHRSSIIFLACSALMGVDFNTLGDSEAGTQVAGFGNSCGFSRLLAAILLKPLGKLSIEPLIPDTSPKFRHFFENGMKYLFADRH